MSYHHSICERLHFQEVTVWEISEFREIMYSEFGSGKSQSFDQCEEPLAMALFFACLVVVFVVVCPGNGDEIVHNSFSLAR